MSDPADILALCRAKGLRVATAESCTGGLVGAALTDVPGSSDVYQCGVISYSNASKMVLLDLSRATLDICGAVSEEVAKEMARGLRRNMRVDIAVSVTGIAGPGGSEHKPEGRVCFGLATRRGIETETVEFGALGRAEVRARARDHALGLIEAAARAAG